MIRRESWPRGVEGAGKIQVKGQAGEGRRGVETWKGVNEGGMWGGRVEDN